MTSPRDADEVTQHRVSERIVGQSVGHQTPWGTGTSENVNKACGFGTARGGLNVGLSSFGETLGLIVDEKLARSFPLTKSDFRNLELPMLIGETQRICLVPPRNCVEL